MSKPVMIDSPDFSKLKALAQEYIDEVEKEKYVDDDFPHYITECLLETFFGCEVWEYINGRDEED